MPPGSLVCPFPACDRLALSSLHLLETHLRNHHHIQHLSHAKQLFWTSSTPSHGNGLNSVTGSAHTSSAHTSSSAHATEGVLKTIPPDHSYPLFDDCFEAHLLARHKDLLVAECNRASSLLHLLALRLPRQILLQRRALPSYCAVHRVSSNTCLTCITCAADADFSFHADPATSSSSSSSSLVASRPLTASRSVLQHAHFARPHAPYQLLESVDLDIHSLQMRLQVLGVSALKHPHLLLSAGTHETKKHASSKAKRTSVTSSSSSNTSSSNTSSNALVQSLRPLFVSPSSSSASSSVSFQQLCTSSTALFHGDDQRVLLLNRDRYLQLALTLSDALPLHLRRGGVQGGGAQTGGTSSYRLTNARAWPEHFLARPVFLLRDREEVLWLGVEVLLLAAQLHFGDDYDLVSGTLKESKQTAASTSTTNNNTNNNSSNSNNSLKNLSNARPRHRHKKPAIQLLDPHTHSDLSHLLATTLAHELIPSSALTQGGYRTQVDAPERCSEVVALLSTPEALLFVPAHCVEAALPLRYLSHRDLLQTRQRRKEAAGDGVGEEVQVTMVRDDQTADLSRLHEDEDLDDLDEDEEESEEVQLMTPLARWKHHQQQHETLCQGSDPADSDGPSLKEIAPARFFVRI